jgi:hypothetical protein
MKMAAIVKKMWTENEVQKLDEMYKQGIDTRDIAEQLGRTQRSVMGKVNRHQFFRHPSAVSHIGFRTLSVIADH